MPRRPAIIHHKKIGNPYWGPPLRPSKARRCGECIIKSYMANVRAYLTKLVLQYNDMIDELIKGQYREYLEQLAPEDKALDLEQWFEEYGLDLELDPDVLMQSPLYKAIDNILSDFNLTLDMVPEASDKLDDHYKLNPKLILDTFDQQEDEILEDVTIKSFESLLKEYKIPMNHKNRISYSNIQMHEAATKHDRDKGKEI